MIVHPARVVLLNAPTDRLLARDLAVRLMDFGIPTWLAEYQTRAGPLTQERLAAALRGATYVVVFSRAATNTPEWDEVLYGPVAAGMSRPKVGPLIRLTTEVISVLPYVTGIPAHRCLLANDVELLAPALVETAREMPEFRLDDVVDIEKLSELAMDLFWSVPSPSTAGVQAYTGGAAVIASGTALTLESGTLELSFSFPYPYRVTIDLRHQEGTEPYVNVRRKGARTLVVSAFGAADADRFASPHPVRLLSESRHHFLLQFVTERSPFPGQFVVHYTIYFRKDGVL